MDPLSLTGEPTLSPTQSISTIAISPTERPTKGPTVFQTEQPTIEPTSAASQTQINDFSSKAAMQRAGWSWNLHNPWDFIKDNSAFCNGAPTSAYCGFTHPGDLTLSYKFKQSGRIQIDWGQSWASGQVVLRVNGIEIDSMNSIGRKTTEFDVSSGDVLEVAEVNLSIIVMYDIIFTSDGSVPSTTAMSTISPTFEPSMRWKPLTMSPTFEPSMRWKALTMSPTFEPSTRARLLTTNPTLSPTEQPTKEPTLFPTEQPTIEPTMPTTTAMSQTMNPTLSPTQQPTQEPTLFQTEQPTIDPTMLPISRNETTNGEDTPLIPFGDISNFTLSIIVFFTVFCVMFTCAASWKTASKSTGSKREGNQALDSGDTEEGQQRYLTNKEGISVSHAMIYE